MQRSTSAVLVGVALAAVAAAVVWGSASMRSFGSRPTDLDWIQSLVAVCAVTGAPITDVEVAVVDRSGRCRPRDRLEPAADLEFVLVRAPHYVTRPLRVDALARAVRARAAGDTPTTRPLEATLVPLAYVELAILGDDDPHLDFVFTGLGGDRHRALLEARARAREDSRTGARERHERALLALDLAFSGSGQVQLPPEFTAWSQDGDLSSAAYARAQVPSERLTLSPGGRLVLELPARTALRLVGSAAMPLLLHERGALATSDEPETWLDVPLFVEMGATRAFEISVPARGSFTGHLTLPGPGTPYVSILRPDSSSSDGVGGDRLVARAEVGESGRFHVTDLPVGAYDVRVRWQSPDGRTRLHWRRPFVVTADATASVDLDAPALERASTFDVVTVDEDGRPVPALAQQAERRLAFEIRGPSGALVDAFELDLPAQGPVRLLGLDGSTPGTCAVRVIAPQESSHWRDRYGPLPELSEGWTRFTPGDALTLSLVVAQHVDVELRAGVLSAADVPVGRVVHGMAVRRGDGLVRRVLFDRRDGAQPAAFEASTRLPRGAWDLVALVRSPEGEAPSPAVLRGEFVVTDDPEPLEVHDLWFDVGGTLRVEASAIPAELLEADFVLRPRRPEWSGVDLWSRWFDPERNALEFGGLPPGEAFVLEPLGLEVGPVEAGVERVHF